MVRPHFRNNLRLVQIREMLAGRSEYCGSLIPDHEPCFKASMPSYSWDHIHRVKIGWARGARRGFHGLCLMMTWAIKRTNTGNGQDKEGLFLVLFIGMERSGFEIQMRSIGHRLNDPHPETCCESILSSMISGLTKFMQGSVILGVKASDDKHGTCRHLVRSKP